MNHNVRMKQLIEGVEVARVTGRQPAKHHRLARIDDAAKLLPQDRARRSATAASREKPAARRASPSLLRRVEGGSPASPPLARAMSPALCDGRTDVTDRDPMLEPFEALIGTWETEARHRLVDDVVTGSVTFEWLEG